MVANFDPSLGDRSPRDFAEEQAARAIFEIAAFRLEIDQKLEALEAQIRVARSSQDSAQASLLDATLGLLQRRAHVLREQHLRLVRVLEAVGSGAAFAPPGASD
jgi:hypothetical protein